MEHPGCCSENPTADERHYLPFSPESSFRHSRGQVRLRISENVAKGDAAAVSIEYRSVAHPSKSQHSFVGRAKTAAVPRSSNARLLQHKVSGFSQRAACTVWRSNFIPCVSLMPSFIRSHPLSCECTQACRCKTSSQRRACC